jgi:hypothetical protein
MKMIRMSVLVSWLFVMFLYVMCYVLMWAKAESVAVYVSTCACNNFQQLTCDTYSTRMLNPALLLLNPEPCLSDNHAGGSTQAQNLGAEACCGFGQGREEGGNAAAAAQCHQVIAAIAYTLLLLLLLLLHLNDSLICCTC